MSFTNFFITLVEAQMKSPRRRTGAFFWSGQIKRTSGDASSRV